MPQGLFICSQVYPARWANVYLCSLCTGSSLALQNSPRYILYNTVKKMSWKFSNIYLKIKTKSQFFHEFNVFRQSCRADPLFSSSGSPFWQVELLTLDPNKWLLEGKALSSSLKLEPFAELFWFWALHVCIYMLV